MHNVAQYSQNRPVNFRYPVFLDVTGKRCLVTGAGYEIPGKVKALADAGAEVVYVNPEADSEIQRLAGTGLITWIKREFQPQDLNNCFLVVTDRNDNAEVFRLSEQRHVLCNAVDDPDHCRFSFGSLHRQGDLTIAISTNGWAPAMAVRLRQKLQREIGPEYAELLAFMKEIRPEISGRIQDFTARRELWYRIVDSDALELLRKDRTVDAKALIRGLIEDAVSSTSRAGTSADGVDR